MAARGMPDAMRTRSSFDSSIADEKPRSPRRAAAVSCSSADNPRKYIHSTGMLWIVGTCKRATISQNAAEAHQDQSRLADTNAPENLQCFVAGILAEGTLGGRVERIDEPAVIILREVVHRATNQKMHIQLTPQFAQLAAGAATQNRFGDSGCSAQPCDDASHGAYFDLISGVANEKYFPTSEFLPHGNPTRIHRNAGALKSERLEIALCEKRFEMLSSLRTHFTDQAKSTTFRGFRYQSVKIRCVGWNEPDADSVGRHVFGKRHNGLNERDRLRFRPSRGMGDTACRSVRGDNCLRGKLLGAVLGGVFQVQSDLGLLCLEAAKISPEGDLRAGLLRVFGEGMNERRAFNDQIRLVERDGSGAAVGEKLKFANFVDDAG